MRGLALGLLLVGCLGSGQIGDDDDAPPEAAEDVAFDTRDGLTLAATFQAGRGAVRGPAAVLLSEVDEAGNEGMHDRASLAGLRQALSDAGVAALAIDWRSHGDSDDAAVPLGTLASARDQLQLDVEAAVDYLETRPQEVDPDRILAVGVGLGGTLAVVAVHDTRAEGVVGAGTVGCVAVSARADRARDLNDFGNPNLDLGGCFFLAGADAAEDAGSAEELFNATEDPREVLLVEGTDAHGLELLQSASLAGDIADWIRQEF